MKIYAVAATFGAAPEQKLFVHRVVAPDQMAAVGICCTQWGRLTDQPLTGIAVQELDREFMSAAMDALRDREPGTGAKVFSLVRPGDDGAVLPPEKMAEPQPHSFQIGPTGDLAHCAFCDKPFSNAIHTKGAA